MSDPLRYVGDKKWQRGYIAVSVDIPDHGPFQYRVLATPERYMAPGGFFPRNIPVETFYYLTFVGFASEWKREKTDI